MNDHSSPTPSPNRRAPRRILMLALATTFASGSIARAQTPAPATQTKGAATPADVQDDPDGRIVEAVNAKPKTPAETKEEAWKMLSDAVKPDKREPTRIQAIAALGLLGSTKRSLAILENSMLDHDQDIRIAALLAAGQTKSPNVTTDIRKLLDDKEPNVAYAAALTLWKMHDRSGEDILTAVASGGRKAAPGFKDGTEHSIHQQMQDPAGMAKFGAMQGAYLLLGPFGYGLTAYEYIHKNGGDSARVSAIEAISQNHTDPIRKELIAELIDKDLGVRVAACKGLARYHEPEVAPALAKVFSDEKPPARFTAAAAYLISTGAAMGSPIDSDPKVPAPVKH